MADLSINQDLVVAAVGALGIIRGYAGVSSVAGKMVYKEAASGKFKLADSNGGSAEVKAPVGISMGAFSDGQPLAVFAGGDITIGATLVAGTVYALSDTPGGICPIGDVGAGEQVVVVGVAISTTVLRVSIINSGVTL